MEYKELYLCYGESLICDGCQKMMLNDEVAFLAMGEDEDATSIYCEKCAHENEHKFTGVNNAR